MPISGYSLLCKSISKELAYIVNESRIIQEETCPGESICTYKLKQIQEAGDRAIEKAQMLWQSLEAGDNGGS